MLGTIVKAHPFRKVLLQCTEKLEAELKAAEGDADKTALLKENWNYIQFQLKTIGGLTAEERAVKMLRVLGFDEFGQKKLVSELSGGLRMRVALCMAFIIEPDLLLLDEPTNHLDFPSVLWLENRLRGYKSSFLVVSHDRELLNNGQRAAQQQSLSRVLVIMTELGRAMSPEDGLTHSSFVCAVFFLFFQCVPLCCSSRSCRSSTTTSDSRSSRSAAKQSGGEEGRRKRRKLMLVCLSLCVTLSNVIHVFRRRRLLRTRRSMRFDSRQQTRLSLSQRGGGRGRERTSDRTSRVLQT